MSKLSIFLIVMLTMLFSCGKKEANISVKYIGNEVYGNVDVCIALANGEATNFVRLIELDILEIERITPSIAEQIFVFTVPIEKSYTPFIFQDLNSNNSFELDEPVRIGLPIVFLEDDVETKITYNY